MTHHVEPPQGRRVIVQEIRGINPPGHPASKAELLSPDELAMLIFRRDLYRKKLQHRYDIKLFRERFHRDMAVFEAQLAHLREVEAQRQRAIQRRFDPAQPRDAYGRWTDGGGGGGKVLDIGTLHPDPQDGAGDAAPREAAPKPTRVAQVTGTLSDVAQPLLGDRSSPGEATAAGPAALAMAMALGRALQSVLPAAIFRRILIELFNTTPPSKPTPGIGHNSGETEPLDPAPTPPPNPVPSAVGAGVALSQAKPDTTPSRDFVSLREDQTYGGHGYDRHINITREGIADRVKDMARTRTYRTNGPFEASRFFSEAEADAYVRQVLDAHPAEVAAVRSGSKGNVAIELQFSRAVGELAYLASRSHQVVFRMVDRVRVVIMAEPLSPRGYIVLTAYPVP